MTATEDVFAGDDAPRLPTPQPAASESQRYVRPVLPDTLFLDEAGQPIDYGSRWGADGPPEGSYSVDRHPERFAGLHTVAAGLIEHLELVYDVDVIRGQTPDAAATLLRPNADVVELVHVQPRSPDGAPLRFALNSYPGVIVEAGVLHAFAHPACGCEACDESIDHVASELENLVLSVAAGGFAEHYPVGPNRELHLDLVMHDEAGTLIGSLSGGGRPSGLSAEQLAAGEAALAALPHGWQPWPLRPGARETT